MKMEECLELCWPQTFFCCGELLVAVVICSFLIFVLDVQFAVRLHEKKIMLLVLGALVLESESASLV